MTLHVLSAWPGEASHRIIWLWVDMFALTSPEDCQSLALRPTVLLQTLITRISALFKGIPVTGCCCWCHRELVWDFESYSTTLKTEIFFERIVGRIGEWHFEIWRADRQASMWWNELGLCDRYLLILSLTVSRKKRGIKVRLICNQRGLVSSFSWFSFYILTATSLLSKNNWKQKINDLVPQSVWRNSSLCSIKVYVKQKMLQLMFITDYELKYMLQLHGVLNGVWWRVVKTKHFLSIVTHFDNYLISLW